MSPGRAGTEQMQTASEPHTVNQFQYRNQQLHIENVAASQIAAEFGTPCYVYSQAALEEAYRQYDQAFAGHDHLVCYAMKANSNLSILKLFSNLGAGFDIVSGGELQRVLAAGGSPQKVVFSGVGKSSDEIRMALEAGILCFNVESIAELHRINAVAGTLDKRAPVSLRVNPDVDAKTHPYISTGLKDNKFGIAYNDALATYQLAAGMGNIEIIGIDCHIGSQLTEIAPFVAALEKLLALIDQLEAAGIKLHHVDLGGGVGIRYDDETPIVIAEYAQALLGKLAGRDFKIILEPGRFLVGNAGVLLTRVEYLKSNEQKHFAIIDGAMNDLMRPSLYEAYHLIQAVQQGTAESRAYDVVGPVCESGDFLGKGRELSIEAGDLLAVMSAGAYGMAMSSNYNTRNRAAEVLVSGTEARQIRHRDTVQQQLQNEIDCL